MPDFYLRELKYSHCLSSFFLSVRWGDWGMGGIVAVKGSSGDGTINLTMVFALCNGQLRALQASFAQSHT